MTRLAFLFLLASLALFGADVTGSWEGEVVTDAGTGNPTFTFKQDGAKLTGTYTGMLGEHKFTGTVEGNRITFGFTGEAQGQTLKVEYSGAIESATLIKGKVDLGGFASGTFTLKKK
jgi:hypothetical protein